ncbi:hypothetical protein U1Q18_048128 [Sarracenia purpurea var. burkii]
MDDLQHTEVVMAGEQNLCAPSKDATAMGNVVEKVSRGAITRFQEGISPLPSSLKSGLDMGLSNFFEATLNEEEVNDIDALAEKDPQYDEAQQRSQEKSRIAKGKAPVFDEGGPTSIPRAVQVPGSRFQRGGRGGGRAPMGRTWARAAEVGTESSEAPQGDPQVFEGRCKRNQCLSCKVFGHVTKRCKIQSVPKEKAEWVTVEKGKGIDAGYVALASSSVLEAEKDVEMEEVGNASMDVQKVAVQEAQSDLLAEREVSAHKDSTRECFQPRTPLTRSRSGTAIALMEGQGTQEDPFTPLEDKEPDPPPKGPKRSTKSRPSRKKKHRTHSG